MEEDIVIYDSDGSQRNAVIVRGQGRPPIITQGNSGGRWPASASGRPPVYYPPPSSAPMAYQSAPPASAPAPVGAASLNGLKSWIPDLVHVLASLSPLPAPPVSTGDLAKDFNNGMQYAAASLATLKRTDLLHTVARIAERRL